MFVAPGKRILDTYILVLIAIFAQAQMDLKRHQDALEVSECHVNLDDLRSCQLLSLHVLLGLS